jgi:hypothetical protein
MPSRTIQLDRFQVAKKAVGQKQTAVKTVGGV